MKEVSKEEFLAFTQEVHKKDNVVITSEEETTPTEIEKELTDIDTDGIVSGVTGKNIKSTYTVKREGGSVLGVCTLEYCKISIDGEVFFTSPPIRQFYIADE